MYTYSHRLRVYNHVLSCVRPRVMPRLIFLTYNANTKLRIYSFFFTAQYTRMPLCAPSTCVTLWLHTHRTPPLVRGAGARARRAALRFEKRNKKKTERNAEASSRTRLSFCTFFFGSRTFWLARRARKKLILFFFFLTRARLALLTNIKAPTRENLEVQTAKGRLPKKLFIFSDPVFFVVRLRKQFRN